MSETPHAAGHDEGHALAEPDRTNVAMLTIVVAVTTAFLVVTVWGLDVYFHRHTEALKREKIYSVPSAELAQLRAEEQKALNTFGVVDADKGVYRIPVERAMLVFVTEVQARLDAGYPQRVGPELAPAAPAAPAPAPGAPAK